jgi:hypothetical protein
LLVKALGVDTALVTTAVAVVVLAKSGLLAVVLQTVGAVTGWQTPLQELALITQVEVVRVPSLQVQVSPQQVVMVAAVVVFSQVMVDLVRQEKAAAVAEHKTVAT